MARSTQQYKSRKAEDDEALRLALIRLAKQYGRYGYRKIAKLLRLEGWVVNHSGGDRGQRPRKPRNGRAAMARGRPAAAEAP